MKAVLMSLFALALLLARRRYRLRTTAVSSPNWLRPCFPAFKTKTSSSTLVVGSHNAFDVTWRATGFELTFEES